MTRQTLFNPQEKQGKTLAPPPPSNSMLCLRGSRDGAVVRALAFQQCGPGSIPVPGVYMWVEFVVGSRPCSGGFSPRTLVFLPP